MPHQRLLIGHLLYKVLSFRCISLRSICSGRSLFSHRRGQIRGAVLLDEVMHLGCPAFVDVLLICLGKCQFFFSTISPFLMTLTVMLWSMNVSTSKSSISMSHSTFRISFLPIFPLRAFLMIATVQSNLSS